MRRWAWLALLLALTSCVTSSKLANHDDPRHNEIDDDFELFFHDEVQQVRQLTLRKYENINHCL